MFYLFVSETFNEFKGKVVHLYKKWLPFLNCAPPGVTGDWKDHCDEHYCHLFMNNFLSYVFTICRVLWVISIWYLEKCLPYLLGKPKLGPKRNSVVSFSTRCSLTQVKSCAPELSSLQDFWWEKIGSKIQDWRYCHLTFIVNTSP